MAIDPNDVFLNAGDELREGWPDFLPQPAALDDLWIGNTSLVRDEARNIFTLDTKLLFPTQLGFAIPGLDEVSLVLGARNTDTVVPVHVELRPDVVFRIANVPLAVRLPASLLKPVRRAAATDPNQPAIWEVDPTREFPDIAIADATFEVDGDGNIDFSVAGHVDLPAVMLGESGIVIEARDIEFFLDPRQPPAGQAPGFRGIFLRQATLSLPGELGDLVGVLQVENAYISNGGFTGTVSETFTPGKQAQFFGSELELQQVTVSLVQNAFVGSSMRGRLTLPFFDEALDVEISFTTNGDFSVRLSDDSGIIVLEKDGVFRLAVNSLRLEVKDGLFRTIVSGDLTPTIQQDVLDWPTFEVRELSIDANGHVALEGGWLNLPKALTLSFFGFQLEITKLGFGQNDDGGKWVAMNGALRLVDGIQAGASVEGLRVTWFNDGRSPALSFEGIGIEFEIPNSLRFKGFVAFRQLNNGAETVRRFDGDIKLELLALNLTVDAELVFGHANAADGSYNFMGIFLGVELPAGIPLFTTGLGLYGMAGLFASQLAPDKAPDEEWYGVGPSDGWYKRPEVGVTDLSGKWTNKRDALGLGMGVTIGTLADNGYAFSGRLLLLMLFPGPVIMIEGRANILKERSKLGDDPLFRTLAVLDFNVGTFLFGIDAQYRYDDGGRLVELGGSAEAYFNLSNPGDWHFWLGQREPRDKRIRARIFQLFEANAYFMLDASSLAMGAWFGYSKSWKFSKLKVSVDLWSEANVGVSWRPPQFTGGMVWHGGVKLSAFGIGIGFTVEVGIDATVFDPFHVDGKLHVELNLPWPLPDLGATVHLEWGPEVQWPKLPLPLSEAAIEHVKVSTSWPLPRTQGLLAPNYDSGDGLRDTVPGTPPQPASIDADPPPANAPIVPMDARPRLTFSRPIHDDALVGVNVRVQPTYERIGNPTDDKGPIKVKYSLREVRLDKWKSAAPAGWVQVARQAATELGANASGVDPLYGSWAPIPDFKATDGSGDAGGHVQVKLWLWSANPFDYTRRVGRAWDEWFTDHYPNYPCITPDTPKATCFDFTTIPVKTPLDNGPSSIDPYIPSYRHPDNPAVEIIVDDAVMGGVPLVQILPAPVDGRTRGVCFTPLPAAIPDAPPPAPPIVNFLVGTLLEQSPVPAGYKAMLILMPTPNAGVHVLISPTANVIAYDSAGVLHSAATAPRASDQAEILAKDVHVVVAYWNSNVCFSGVCELIGPSDDQIAHIAVVAQHNVDSVEHFEERGFVFDSHTDYRIRVVTEIDAIGERELGNSTRKTTQTEYAFFKTDGPPKLADLTIPIGQENQEQIKLRNPAGELIRNDGSPVGSSAPVLASELNDLGIYVRQTLPVTVPAPGERPDLPRPVYRAYDLGVEFNENYVQLMYRLDGRDLALYLFDQNNAPVRDLDGRILVLRSNWEVAATPIVDSTESVWTTTLALSTCAGGLSVSIKGDEQLSLVGITLDSDKVYDARLNPLLLHDDFADDDLYQLNAAASGSDATLGRWTVEDQGGGAGASNWVIAERGTPATRLVTQTTDYFAGSLDGRVPDKPGTVLWLHDRAELPADHRDQPSSWTDYRVSVILRTEDDDALGVVFRRASANRYYRFSMDRERKYRRLTLHFDSVVTVLAEDEFAYQLNTDYEITVEALGAALVVYQDGEAIFRVTEGSIAQGTIGLYCWGLQLGSFSDVRVDDFRLTSRSPYLYRFTTSRFANFAHEVHSYQDETWLHDIDAAAVALLSPAVSTSQPAADPEHRAWDAFEASPTVDALVRSRVDELQVTRLMQGGETRALLLRSPEPLDVSRTRVDVARAEAQGATRVVPATVKLTEVTRHASDPNQESVALILRDAFDPSGLLVEQRRLPPLLLLPGAGSSLLDEQFTGSPSGLLYSEAFGPNTLNLYQIVDQGTSGGPSSWTVDADTILQSSDINDGASSAANLDKLGTMAIRGRPDWSNVRLRAVLSSSDDGSMGVVFRYRDEDNYYRFELNRSFGYHRLIKKQAGVVSVLAEDSSRGYELDQDYELEIVAVGGRLVGYVNHVLEFAVSDLGLDVGRVGLYCWANAGARFKALSVRTADRSPLLLEPPTVLSGLTTVDEGTTGAPSSWQLSGSAIVQQAAIQAPDDGSSKFPGTDLLAGSTLWEDVRVSARVTTSAGRAVGLLFRAQDAANCYRLSWDSVAGYRRLIKVVLGVATVLWQDNGAAPAGVPHDVTISAHGRRLSAWFDGAPLFDLSDTTFAAGRVGLYTWNDGSAEFEGWTVIDDTLTVSGFQIIDEGQVDGPSEWRVSSGVLEQRSNIFDGQNDGTVPDKLGTLAINGEATWTDYRIAVELRSDDDDAVGLVFRYVDQNNYYRLSLDAERSYRRLIKKVAGVVSVLWEDAASYGPGSDFTLTVDAIGDRLKAYQDSTALFDVSDSSLASGRVGLYAWNNDAVRFSRVRVSTPTVEATTLFQDQFATGSLAGWTAVDSGTLGAPSHWLVVAGVLHQDSNINSDPVDGSAPEKEGTYLAVGDVAWTDVVLRVRLESHDDDAIGVQFRVSDNDNYYRFSMDSGRSYRRLVSKLAGTFEVLWQDDIAYEVGRAYELVIVARGDLLEGYLDGILVFSVIDEQHTHGRVGLYCWANQDARFASVRVYPGRVFNDRLLLQDEFSVLGDVAYDFQDEGELDGPSIWSASDSKLLQTSAIRSADTVSLKGGNAIRNQLDVADFRASAIMRSSSQGGMGLVFRSTADGYYRFALDRGTGTRYLLKKAGTTFSVLFSESFQFQLDSDYALSVECVGPQLTGYVNGARVFSLRDESHDRGSVGLYVANNPTAAFDRLTVAPADWIPFYQFGKEDSLPAGCRLRVFSGSPSRPFSADPLETVRHVASGFELGEVQLAGSVVELRVVEQGQPAHQREFLPDDSFGALAVRVLRRADGTSYVFVPDGGGSFARGDHRLRFEYRRGEPGPILSERGESTPEVVRIDVPWDASNEP